MAKKINEIETYNENLKFLDKKGNPIQFNEEDFKLTQQDKKIHDVKFESKATTFAKDAFKRFLKNRASVVGGVILGFITILAFIVPIANNNDIDTVKPYERFLEPKIFNAGTGWWDGTRQFNKITYDTVTEMPDPSQFLSKNAVSNLKVDEETTYINSYNRYGKGGYVRFSTTPLKADEETTNKFLTTYQIDSIDLDSSLVLNTTLLGEYEDDDYAFAPYVVSANFDLTSPSTNGNVNLILKEESKDFSEVEIDILTKIKETYADATKVSNFKISFTLKDALHISNQLLIKDFILSSDSNIEDYKSRLADISFKEANEFASREKEITSGVLNPKYWSSNANKYLYNVEIYYCSFVYDTYEAVYGTQEKKIPETELSAYRKNGWCTYKSSNVVGTFKVLDENKCPILEIKEEIKEVGGGVVVKSYIADVANYKYLGYESMPSFIFGTDSSGKDLCKLVFRGLRTSLLLGILVSAVCFIFGLCWGSISGYFGGTVDLVMERFCDILGGLPWIVVMTLSILLLGNNFFTFALALCLTGWMGTSARTRTQFYRFKRREYVLASRTLGASDFRLIFKHILPNSMGTIITSAVLMIPSTIFSEATISYLGLGLSGDGSLGVILSKNQQFLSTYPYLLFVPAVIIALIMISFNLFGNGLRDAMNPSLKGSE